MDKAELGEQLDFLAAGAPASPIWSPSVRAPQLAR
jgi:hypothetical protein